MLTTIATATVTPTQTVNISARLLVSRRSTTIRSANWPKRVTVGVGRDTDCEVRSSIVYRPHEHAVALVSSTQRNRHKLILLIECLKQIKERLKLLSLRVGFIIVVKS